jgi:hypothetical protein
MKAAISPAASKYFVQDTGDGALFIFSPETDKREMIAKWLPKLNYKLVNRNRTAAPFMTIKARAVVHFGEYLKDRPDLTQEGVVSNEIILASRLLDSEFLRGWREDSDDTPICLCTTNEFYQKVICQQLPSEKNRFSKHKVVTKDRTLTAWAYDYAVLPQAKKELPNVSLRSRKRQRKVLADLSTRSIYVSIADLYNQNLYKRTAGQAPLINHLETALLLGENAILHCADPYRSPKLLNLLYQYKDFIEAGNIILLLGSHI